MNDHVHALVEPFRRSRSKRSCSSWKVVHVEPFLEAQPDGCWQPEYYDRIIRNEHEFEEKLGYIVANPYLRWPGIESYPWVWIDAAAYD